MFNVFAIRFCFVLCVTLWAAATIREPLWIDELHTLWTISGGWNEVISRAIEGNQTPLYFVVLKIYVEQLNYWSGLWGWSVFRASPFDLLSPIPLRTFSLIGWAVLATLLSHLIPIKKAGLETVDRSIDRESTRGNLLLLSGLGAFWLVSDRIGTFYATEARPYIWVAVASCVAITRMISLKRFEPIWVLSCCIAFYLHYTAIFIVALSWCIRTWLQISRGERLRGSVPESLLLGFLLVPGVLHLYSINNRSSQWNFFAGASDFATLLRLLPWFAWTIIPLGAVLLKQFFDLEKIDQLMFSRKDFLSRKQSSRFDVDSLLGGVALLAFLCLFGVWFLCWMKWVPLMHSRYLIGIYPAIWIVGLGLLSFISQTRWVVATGILSIAVNGWVQGSLPLWERGQILAWQRTEDWNAVRKQLVEHSHPEDSLFLAPFLVETQKQRVIDEAAPSRKEYFAFAVHAFGMNPFGQEGIPKSELHVLSNDVSEWPKAIEKNSGEILKRGGVVWLLARSESTVFEVDDSAASDGVALAASDIGGPLRAIVSFRAGNLQLWQIQLHK